MPLRTQEIERLYDEHAQALFGFLLHLTRNEAQTQDLLQEIFIRLNTRPELLDGVRQERAFLLRLSHNLALDSLRRSSTRTRAYEALAQEPAPLFAPAADPDAAAFRRAVEAALQELPLDQRVVAHLKLWEGLTFEEIAETLDIPLNTAASRYRYALDKLRDRLRPIYDEIQ